MAKFILTNNIDISKKLNEIYSDAGFKNPKYHTIDGFYLTTYDKKIKPINNLKTFNNGDFITIIGSLVFNNKKKDDALEEIYYLFDHNLINDLRKKILGNYFIAIRKNGIISVFTDKYQVASLFYFVDGSDFAISNSSWHLASAKPNLEIDKISLLQETMLVSPVGRETPFSGIFKLFGDTVFRISKNDISLIELPFSDDYVYIKDHSFDCLVKNYTELVREEFEKVSIAYRGLEFGIHQTGGLDNRTVFSAFMSLGVQPKTFYGIGNSPLTNTNPKDLEIVKEYSEKFNLDLNFMDWSHIWEEDQNNWNEQVIRYGFLQSLYGGSSSFFSFFENGKYILPDFMECGYFGEVLRQREWAYQRINSKSEGYTLKEFLEGYLFGPGYGGLFHDKLTPLFAEVREKVTMDYIFELNKKKVKEYVDKNSFFSIDEWSKLEWTHMRNSNSLYVNFLNDFTSSIALFGTEKLHDYALNVPAKYLQNGKFQLAVIENLFPQALDVSILTHGTPHIFDKKNKTLEKRNGKEVFDRKKLKNIVSSNRYLFFLFTNLFSMIKKIIHVFNEKKIKDRELKYRKSFTSLLENNQLTLSVNASYNRLHVVYLGILSHYLNAISLIKKNKI